MVSIRKLVDSVSFTLTTPQVERKWCTIFKRILAQHHSMHRNQTMEVWMVRLLSAVGKLCGYSLNTEFAQVMHVCTLNLCGL